MATSGRGGGMSRAQHKCNRNKRKTYHGIVPLPLPHQMSGVFNIDDSMPKSSQAVRAPHWGSFVIHCETFSIPAIANGYVNRRVLDNASLENGMGPFVCVHMAGKDEIDLGAVKNAFHCRAHADFFPFVVVCPVAVVPVARIKRHEQPVDILGVWMYHGACKTAMSQGVSVRSTFCRSATSHWYLTKVLQIITVGKALQTYCGVFGS